MVSKDRSEAIMIGANERMTHQRFKVEMAKVFDSKSCYRCAEIERERVMGMTRQEQIDSNNLARIAEALEAIAAILHEELRGSVIKIPRRE